MGGNPYQPFAVEQKNQAKEAAAAAETNAFKDPTWNGAHNTVQNTAAWQDVHLDHSHAANGGVPPAWAYAAAEPSWDGPAQSTPALGSTASPPQPAPAFYGSGPPEFSGQTIYNVNQDASSDRCSCNLDWWLFGIGFFTGIAWLIGAFLPYCRRPRFPTRSHHQAHVANIIMSIILVVVIILAIGFAARNHHDYYSGDCCGYSWGFCQPC